VRPILRSILAVVIGFVVGSALMMGVEIIGTIIYPPPPGVDPTDMEAMREAWPNSPVGAKLFVLAAWALGTLAAGWLAAWVGRRAPLLHGLIIGVLFLAAGIYNLIAIPSPLWFCLAGIALFLPAACLGALLPGKGKTAAPAAA
jgi:hypothetical protein